MNVKLKNMMDKEYDDEKNATLKLKKCLICGRVVEVTNDEPVMCCGQEMVDVIPNSTDAAVEKHIPNYEKVEDEIFVTVNHVMEKDHYIEWLELVTDTEKIKVELYPEQEASARFPYVPGSKIYAYCNKHGLWVKEVE